jgi:hypothetical protein
MNEYFNPFIIQEFGTNHERFSNQNEFHLYNKLDEITLTTSLNEYAIQLTVDTANCIVTSFVYNNCFSPLKYAIDVFIPATYLGEDEIVYRLNQQYEFLDDEIAILRKVISENPNATDSEVTKLYNPLR